MPYTLIASIGTGMYDKSKNDSTGYRLTTYRFANEMEIKSRLFLFSILESKNWDINQVILIGSRTSSWDALIAQESESNDQYADMWLKLVEECEQVKGSGISESSLEQLQGMLTERFSIPFLLQAHDSIVDNDTLPSIFPLYRTISEKISTGNDVLLDITHGFRSMPMFLYQSLRFSFIRQTLKNVEILYGEYIPGRSISLVRNLSKFWEFSEASEAFDLFQSSFEGEALALLLENWWPKGAAWMKGFSSLIKTNYVLQIGQSINQLGNSLSGMDADSLSLWKREVFLACSTLFGRFKNSACLSDKILILSDLLIEKHLVTQAIIALQIAVETRIIESAYDRKKIGDYDYWNSPSGPKQFKYALQTKHQLFTLRDLEHERNRIAHGGGTGAWKSSPKKDGIISSENLRKYREDVVALFSVCKVEKQV